MTKTLGETCFQADSYNGYSFVWSELSDGDREVYERMAAAVAARVREQCASIARSFIDPEWPGDDQSRQAESIALQIEGLK